jgi:hypothetical protein
MRSGWTTSWSPSEVLGQHRIALVRHRRAALLAFGEELFGLAHLGALQMADFGGQVLDRSGDNGEAGKEGGVPVARDDLRGDRLDGKAELLGDMLLHPRIHIGEGADGAGDGAGRDLGARRHQPRAVADEGSIVSRELDAESGGLGMDAVAAADGRRVLVLQGALFQCRHQSIDVFN